MRIFTLIDWLGWGGAETLLGDLAEGAPSAGIELCVASFAHPASTGATERLRARGIEPVHVPLHRLFDPGDVRDLRRAITAWEPDVVHTHLAYADMMGGVAARSLGVPAVSTLHLMAWGGDRRQQLKHTLAAQVRRRCMARVVAVSDAGRDAYLGRGWDRPERVVTVLNGVGRTRRPGDGAAVRRELGIGADERVVTMLTVLRPGKGHEEALAALPRIREAAGDVRLLVVGDGPDRERLEAAATALGPAVVFAGHRNDVMAILDASDVLLHPTHVDALPTALIEAGAAAVPVVATRVGGVPEIVDDGQTGLLVPAPPRAEDVAGAVVRVLADDALATGLAEAARRRYDETFTAQRWAARLRAVYDEVARP